MNESIYKKQPGYYSRTVSFENPTGKKGTAAQSNSGNKGSAFSNLLKGQTQVLMDFEGSGIVNKIWMTFTAIGSDPNLLRTLVLRCYWDGSKKAAVEAPIGDFMCVGDNITRFENEYFSSPNGSSFNCYIPMPFRKKAYITITNESEKDLSHLFYCIDFIERDPSIIVQNELYFHAYFNRENPTDLYKDYTVLPKINGSGRFLGATYTLNENKAFDDWWGEGEFKAYIDGDVFPTICTTGAEDYVGAGWGLHTFNHRYQGCLNANKEEKKYNFYRFHVTDPIFFEQDLHVTLQHIAATSTEKAKTYLNNNEETQLVALDPCDYTGKVIPLTDDPMINENTIDFDQYPEKAVYYKRLDDYSSVAYFYLDSPTNDLINTSKC